VVVEILTIELAGSLWAGAWQCDGAEEDVRRPRGIPPCGASASRLLKLLIARDFSPPRNLHCAAKGHWKPENLLMAVYSTPRGGQGLAGWPNFGGLVLGCIEADFCKPILILQHFPRSTRFAYFCTTPKLKFADFRAISQIYLHFKCHFCKILVFFFCKVMLFFAENLMEFCQNCGKFQINAGNQCIYRRAR